MQETAGSADVRRTRVPSARTPSVFKPVPTRFQYQENAAHIVVSSYIRAVGSMNGGGSAGEQLSLPKQDGL